MNESSRTSGLRTGLNLLPHGDTQYVCGLCGAKHSEVFEMVTSTLATGAVCVFCLTSAWALWRRHLEGEQSSNESVPATLDDMLGRGDSRLAKLMRTRFLNCRLQGFSVGVILGSVMAAAATWAK